MTSMLASLDRLEELSANHSNNDDSHSLSNSASNNNSFTNESSMSDSNVTGSASSVGDADFIAKRAGKEVMCLRLSAIFFLLSAATAVGAAIFVTTKNAERSAYDLGYEEDATKVFDTFRFNVERKLGALDKLSIDITSYAVGENADWPNFTLPDFEFRAANIKSLADAASILFLPIVEEGSKESWGAYSRENMGWLEDSIRFQQSATKRNLDESLTFKNGVANEIFAIAGDQIRKAETANLSVPIWQHFPAIPELVNYDLFSNEIFQDDIEAALDSSDATIGVIWELQEEQGTFLDLLNPWINGAHLAADDPVSKFFYPVFNSLGENNTMVGSLVALINWKTILENILPPEVTGIITVLENECGQSYTYNIQGPDVLLVGKGDQHDPSYDDKRRGRSFKELFNPKEQQIRKLVSTELNNDYCPYHLVVYPSSDFEDDFVTNNALWYTGTVVALFLLTILVFLSYDFIARRRQEQAMKRAVQSRAIVSSLFPAAVRDRLFKSDDSSKDTKGHKNNASRRDYSKNKLKNFLTDAMPQEQKGVPEAKPIADLFPHTTVMFADIAGFTRWSSERDPTQVFTLLQTVYHSFDRIAKKRSVFKVETIGDCYVAVTGLPDPQDDHALRMAKFAHECREKFNGLVEKLISTLGSDTASLALRFGLHSGPVTAGVLRGEKSRFQLFGNTVNTAAKMEHTGQPNKIQISGETADLLTEAGKGHWVFLRIDDIAARGGMQTYWVEPLTSVQEARHNNSMPTRVGGKSGSSDNSQRLIDWNFDILKRLLKGIVAYRKDTNVQASTSDYKVMPAEGATVREEVVDVIILPKYDKKLVKTKPDSIDLGKEVEQQLRKFVTLIASMYHDNAFHNFKHASNVCTNANKMMKSIVDDEIYQRTSEPLTQFAVVFSALIHDLDHVGVPNMILMKEKPRIAALYRNKSCAEQNSVDLAWNLLMDPEFENLQEAIFCNGNEFKRFRRIVVNIVMSTDIFDKELNSARDQRWRQAFDDEANESCTEDRANLRATVAIECAMQLADIMHTTQHFHSYCRWNERLLEEMYHAFEMGRSKKDPSADWYQGEIWFFDNVVIPMAKRIKNCGVFGAQGENCLRNALENKREWATKGGEIVQTQLAKFRNKKCEADKASIAIDSEEKNDENRDQNKNNTEEKKAKMEADSHLIEWNVDLFLRLLRQILAHRLGQGEESLSGLISLAHTMKDGTTVRDELVRIISFPFFDREASKRKVDPDSIELSEKVETQLRDYIQFIASMYRDHAFHNFKHASNVATLSNKFLQRIKDQTLKMQVFDPLTQFAIIFSSLIHDVDHPGVPNRQLVKEGKRIAILYNNKSVAEQNSLDLAWSVLMDNDYEDLQKAIFRNQSELERFRQLVVNSVMATDLFDEELISDRNSRWNQAFNFDLRDESLSVEDEENLRATAVVEHILISSDVGHTMQHWHSYKRWNERLYFEMYDAFKNGRLEKDPTPTWYQEEIKFFDSVVIPLATKLHDCGVFGVAGDDAVRCAQSNRKDWVVKGGAIVNDLKKRYEEFKQGNFR